MSTSTLNAISIRRAVAVVVVGVTVGVTGAFAAAQSTSAPHGCRASETDLRTAAEAARRLEAERPELFEQSPRPADYADLRLAAEWARRLEILDPDGAC